jgi:hypothetical protein
MERGLKTHFLDMWASAASNVKSGKGKVAAKKAPEKVGLVPDIGKLA